MPDILEDFGIKAGIGDPEGLILPVVVPGMVDDA